VVFGGFTPVQLLFKGYLWGNLSQKGVNPEVYPEGGMYPVGLTRRALAPRVYAMGFCLGEFVCN